MDDSGILGEIGSVVGAAAGAVGDELKRFGQSATSQVTGGAGGQSAPTGDFSPLEEIKKFGKSVTAQVSGGAGSAQTNQDASAVDQLTGFGKSLTSQITGADTSGGDLQGKKSGKKANFSVLGELSNFAKAATSQVSEGKVLEEMKASDAEFSEREADVLKAKINRIYEEHAAKRKHEEEVKKQQEVQVEVQKKQAEQFKKIEQNDEVNAAIAKSRAENKNYGAE